MLHTIFFSSAPIPSPTGENKLDFGRLTDTNNRPLCVTARKYILMAKLNEKMNRLYKHTNNRPICVATRKYAVLFQYASPCHSIFSHV